MPMLVTEVDLSRHDAAQIAAMVERIVAYRKLVKGCPHIDGWRGHELVQPAWQCMSCGLVVDAKDRTALERWPTAEPELEPDLEPDALGTALAAWSAPHGWVR